ncbi:glycosyltransferase family 4 protein [Zasmidium cellare ATCC 36951]|uniref:Alpha-1,3/1,6-mannosyltransferase ALG2 n=1 Tax=Zasmidium cellare ATCC 36951 TaxID=1080233 RepID=A0A6A6CC69_ZASCE|nr:glycosyltransferase family 4 protein [Zasmidium cellare ATCC 36951]KAF2164774.1 glycosyltransferase family 4 protein [Zasmidium cellare ATCC 36951]
MSSETTASPLNIVFVHPDLGIGGAERLVIDAAVGLQALGHRVTILTSYRNKEHCFEEARDGTLDVRVRGDALFPASIGGRLSILFSILRQLSLVASTGLASGELRELDPDVFIVDQLSACIPFFRLLYPKAKVLFYGHYPDRLLVKEEDGYRKYLKRLYRIPFDALEGWSTGCSDGIVVNSKYTRSIFRQTFPSMRTRDLKVIYPCVDTNETKNGFKDAAMWPDKKILLSINRFEGKKNLDLAIKAYANLSTDERTRARLVVAGGFDPRNHENNITHKHLQDLSESLSLRHATFRSKDTALTDLSNDNIDLLFLLSIPHDLKQRLLHSAGLLIYTPRNEHFGIVPLEAMLAGVPVLATNTGGPLETIYDGRTGWLRSPEKVEQWTDVMRKPLIPSSAETLRGMGQKGRERVLAEFSQTKMSRSFDQEVQRLVQSQTPRPSIVSTWMLLAIVVTIIAVIGGIVAMRFLTAEGGDQLAKAGKSVAANGTPVANGAPVANGTPAAAKVEL